MIHDPYNVKHVHMFVSVFRPTLIISKNVSEKKLFISVSYVFYFTVQSLYFKSF
jgi:hypothetical protein